MQQAVINGLSEGEEQVFETIKSEVVSTIKQQGLFYADEIIDEKLKEIEQSDSISAAGLEIIRDSLHTIPKVITLTAERQPEEVVETVVAESNSKDWIMPCEGRNKKNYGEKRPGHKHDGIDIIVDERTPIRAVYDGIIVKKAIDSKGLNNGYGKYIVIEHNVNGKIVTSEYGHLSEWKKEKNDTVKKGEVIALSGNTGHSSKPHLHLTIREGHYRGKDVNPNKYIKY